MGVFEAFQAIIGRCSQYFSGLDLQRSYVEIRESLRIFGILLYKSWLVRKRHWVSTLLVEILLPLLMVYGVWSATQSDEFRTVPQKLDADNIQEKVSLANLLLLVGDRTPTYYAPANTFTMKLMENVKKCCGRRLRLRGFPTESKFMEYYRLRVFEGMEFVGHPHAVIFDESTDRSTKHLNYKLRFQSADPDPTKEFSLFDHEARLDKTWTALHIHFMIHNHLMQMQSCIDRSFIKMKSRNKPLPELYVQRVPYPAHTREIPLGDKLRIMYRGWLDFAFLLPLLFETLRTTKEKYTGVNVLMAMNGISNTLNLLSWIISSVLLLSVSLLLILLMLINPPTDRLPFLHYGNPVLLYLIFIFHLAHVLTFGIHVSAYFSKAAIVGISLWILSEIQGLILYAINDNTRYLAPYVGIILPTILFDVAQDEIESYENRAEGIQWNNLFTNANTRTNLASSVGMFFIFSVIGMIFHFLLAIYIYAINPGKYGAAKHPLYFLKFKKKESDDAIIESVKIDESTEKNFERVPDGVYTPGIQIRNLKKSFKINPFSKQTVDALRGLSIDFYKGQITSLLGHNGAGKTTMMSILVGMVNPTDGVVFVNSKELKENMSEIRRDMGLCTQEDLYFVDLSVSEQLLFFAMIKRKDDARSIERDLLDILKLNDKKDELPTKLSGGQKRRLCLGMALVGDASTLILDEPTSGLDPESRRVIWNILLKMRGQKTILISTHNMEEADVLGDRIAIMHTGELKSCGNPLFLKRMIGENTVEITLSIESRSDPDKIRNEISKEAVIVKREANKMIVKVPNSPTLPDILDNLEKKKKDLGVTGFSLSLISMEQVFLKITQENDGPSDPQETTDDTEEPKVTGRTLLMQTVQALLRKKKNCALKDYLTMLQKIWITLLALLSTTLTIVVAYSLVTQDGQYFAISLNLYQNPDVLYTSHDKSLGDRYKNVVQNLGGNPIEVTDSAIQNALLKRAKENLVKYNNYMIAAAEINKTSVTALYSEIATFSLPISINLLSNDMLKKLVGPDYSVGLSLQSLPTEVRTYADLSLAIGYLSGFTFALIFGLSVSEYVGQANRETTRGVKHMQMMTGIYGATYWGTMFVFDLIEYALLALLVIVGFMCIDSISKFGLFKFTDLAMEFLLLLLLGISLLPFLYTWTFLKKRTTTIIKYLHFLASMLIGLDIVMAILRWYYRESDGWQTLRLVQKGIFLLVPYVSFLHSQISFFRTVETNARCRRLPNAFYKSFCLKYQEICCDLGCYNGKCKMSRGFFEDSDSDANMKTSVIYHFATSILWFIILALLESRILQKKISKPVGRYTKDSHSDEQVQQEKSMIYEKIQVLRDSELSPGSIRVDAEGDTVANSSDVVGDIPSSTNEGPVNSGQANFEESSPEEPLFMVYELRKTYGSVKAVREVSFAVNRRECFGLLGVNGAGKSTTFRMMIGEELSEHGTMYIMDKEFVKNERFFLSQMGYCPQHDAILKHLNSYDHLSLFARLRGIPENQVEKEVRAWIEKLNLKACAKQSSVTYSGGNKRRLNIAIAMIGNPNIVLMDEPTTGVDPAARRSLWNVIKASQMAGQSLVLTSHSMEECEELCNRLGIMVDGKLVCIGASEQLKQRFGAGYDIKIKMDPEKAKDQVFDIKDDMKSKLSCELTDENIGNLLYHVSPVGMTWRKMYDTMNEMKKKYDCIEDFLVLSSSLEQLFLMFAKSASSTTTQSVNEIAHY